MQRTLVAVHVLRLHFFVLYAVIGAYMPYLPVFLAEDLGLPDWQLGWVAASYGVAVIVFPPLVTYLADNCISGQRLITWAYALSSVALAALALVDDFAGAMVLSLVFGLVYTPLFALLDGLSFTAMAEMTARGEKPPSYDKLRVWGSLGFMVPALVLYAQMATGEANGRAAIVVAAIAAAIGAVCSIWLPRLPPSKRAVEVVGMTELPTASAWRVLSQNPTRALEGPLILLFAAIAIFYGFYARLVLDVGIDPGYVGVVVNIGVIAELPFMFAASWLLRRFSQQSLLIFGAVCLAIRMTLLASILHPVVTIATQLLHGPVIVALYLIPPMFLDAKAPPQVRNHVQGLHAMLCFGVARVLGSVAGGYAAEVDLTWAFTLGAVLSGIAAVWLWLGLSCVRAATCRSSP